MKKIALVVLAVVLSGCDLYMDIALSSKIKGYEIYYGDFSRIETINDISWYIKESVKYKGDKIDTWSSPKTTYNRGYGDCEDIALLYLNILYVKFGIKGDLVAVNIDRTIVNGGSVNHAIVYVDDVAYDPISLEVYNNIGYIYKFDELFY